jgi:hypothetical protein
MRQGMSPRFTGEPHTSEAAARESGGSMSSHSEGGGVAPHPHLIHEGTVTSVDIHGREDVQKLRAGSIGLVSVLFLCITGSEPLAVFMFNFPFVVGTGNERYAPAAFLFATIILTIFSVGYVQMGESSALRVACSPMSATGSAGRWE